MCTAAKEETKAISERALITEAEDDFTVHVLRAGRRGNACKNKSKRQRTNEKANKVIVQICAECAETTKDNAGEQSKCFECKCAVTDRWSETHSEGQVSSRRSRKERRRSQRRLLTAGQTNGRVQLKSNVTKAANGL
jgi:hypothetical protein